MNAITTILLGGFSSLLFIVLKRYYYVHKFAKDHKVPPGPKFYPLFGPFLELYKIKNMRNAVACKFFKKKYGNFAGFFAGAHYMFFMNDYSLNKEIASSEVYDARIPEHALSYKSFFKMSAATRNVIRSQKQGILFAKDEISVKMRTFTVKTLRKLKFGQKTEMGEILKRELMNLIRRVDEDREINGNKVILFNYIKWSIFSSMWSYFAGDSVPVSREELEHVTEAFMVEDEHSSASGIEWYIPWLRDWKWISNFHKLAGGHQVVGEFIEKAIKEKRESGAYKYNPQDYIDYFIKEIDENPSKNFQDSTLSIMCNNLMIAGVVTTANSIQWALFHVLRNPRIYRKLMEEIDKVVGFSTPDLERDGPKMPYLEAIINETLRMENVVPVVSRSTNNDTEIKGYHVPANSMIVIDYDGQNKDPTLWEKPEIFNPDRFLDENNNIKKFDHFTPFGHGRRSCIGEKSARISMFYHIINIFQNYDFITPDDVIRTSGVSTSFVPYELYLTPRMKPVQRISPPLIPLDVHESSPCINSQFHMSKFNDETTQKYQNIMEEFCEDNSQMRTT